MREHWEKMKNREKSLNIEKFIAHLGGKCDSDDI